ncbi:hypothetical protein KCP76_05685 [Salmonella enterica subsp. enterica serovar Weltevreden]|nr:hypothetical protein KCP76_05685 [Salmonella enterica subsp. enterica serovar Weltevreden]
MLVYLADRDISCRRIWLSAETLNWLFRLQGAAPFLGGGFRSFLSLCAGKIEYAINRFMEAKRLLDVLDKQLAHRHVAGERYILPTMTISWFRQRGAGECL